MNHDGVSVTALMVLVAFAIERVTTAVLFLLSCNRRWRRLLAGSSVPAQDPGAFERHQKIFYFFLAGAFAIAVVLLSARVRVLSALDVDAPAVLDVCLTWLVLVAGADRISELVGKPDAGAAEPASKPLVVEGTLTLKEDERTRSRAA